MAWMKMIKVDSHSEGEPLHKIPSPLDICIIYSLLLKYDLWAWIDKYLTLLICNKVLIWEERVFPYPKPQSHKSRFIGETIASQLHGSEVKGATGVSQLLIEKAYGCDYPYWTQNWIFVHEIRCSPEGCRSYKCGAGIRNICELESLNFSIIWIYIYAELVFVGDGDMHTDMSLCLKSCAARVWHDLVDWYRWAVLGSFDMTLDNDLELWIEVEICYGL